MAITYTNDALLCAISANASEAPYRDYGQDNTDGTIYMPELRRSSYIMSTDIICSGIFGITASGSEPEVVDGKTIFKRKYIETVFKSTNGASIQYRGKELRQDDLSLLLFLISKHSGMATSLPIESSPYAMLLQMGRSDSLDNVGRLKESLLRLRGAILVIERDNKKGEAIGFISDFSWDDKKCWSIRLSDRIVGLFEKTTTYLLISQRKQLSEGLQTWLYGYIRANKCGWGVPVELIHANCGSAAKNMQEFARSVRDALKKLAATGVITEESTVRNGKVCIYKC